MLYADLIVPIYHPGLLDQYTQADTEPFMFDRQNRFVLHRHSSKPHFLLQDDQNQWYMAIRWKLADLTEVKYARQVHRPAYVDKSTDLKLADYLESNGFTAQMNDFDKAFVHTTMFAGQLNSVPLRKQLRTANADGDDDPSVVHTVHFIQNEFNGQRTRFLAGFETYSIATITENKTYFENIHLPGSALLYLQYFVYFQRYGFVPSKQMMARLLANLWASVQAMNRDWNKALLTIESIK